MTQGKLRIYGDSRSGNCYKLKLLCAELGMDFDWQEVDILAGDTRTPEFLAMNPNGKIPLLVLPDGRCLAESNAILCFLADGSEYFRGDAFVRAEVLQWLFFANSTRFASAMSGADYGVFANGRWYMSKNIQEMHDWLRFKLQAEAGKE